MRPNGASTRGGDGSRQEPPRSPNPQDRQFTGGPPLGQDATQSHFTATRQARRSAEADTGFALRDAPGRAAWFPALPPVEDTPPRNERTLTAGTAQRWRGPLGGRIPAAARPPDSEGNSESGPVFSGVELTRRRSRVRTAPMMRSRGRAFGSVPPCRKRPAAADEASPRTQACSPTRLSPPVPRLPRWRWTAS